MKSKIFYTLTLSLCLVCSCGENKQEKQNLEAERMLVEQIDSIQNHKRNAAIRDEGKVVADLKFFISKADFYKNKESYLSSIKSDKSSIKNYYIGNFECDPLIGGAKFDNDSLYSVTFESTVYDSDSFQAMIPVYKDLFSLFEDKFGEPDFKAPGFPKLYEISKNQLNELARWDLGKRSISIRVSERYGNYHIDLVIYRNDIEDRIHIENKNTARERRESASSVI